MNGVPLPREHFERKFWETVDKTEGCWLWLGAASVGGYGQFYAGRLWPSGSQGKVYAHRYAYELLVGPIPEGLDIDHLCRVRNCVNPDHMEPVTHRENMLRGDTVVARNAMKTTCTKGHPLDGVDERGRYCTTCKPRPGGYKDRTHCKWGHEFTPENTYREPSGKGRACRTCRLARTKRSNAKSRAATTRGVA